MQNTLYPPPVFPEDLLRQCLQVCDLIREHGGRALLVGGCVRDTILKITPNDVDIEVYGMPADKLESILSPRYPLDLVGRSFGVYKLRNWDIDVALPRRESKTGLGHQAFAVQGDPKMSFEEAASRRDYTINAISWDPLTGELIDPHNGQSDLINRVLRHTSDKFSEDPLRVLRGMQFAARFELTPVAETIKLCRNITPEGIAAERFFEEWRKLLVKGSKPSIGLNFLRDTQWTKWYPELHDLIGCEQDPKWHPEGDVWTHTLHCLDAFARERINNDQEDLIVGLAILCHDMGKPKTSYTDEDGRIRSPRHDEEGVPIAEEFLKRITQNKSLIEAVLPLVRCHMQTLNLYKDNASDGAIRRLARRVGRIDRLVRVDSADRQGRPPLFAAETSPQGQWLLERAEALAVKDSIPKPIIQGRHLIDRGMTPGPHFKKILNKCYEAQTDGEFTDLDRGLTYLDKCLK